MQNRVRRIIAEATVAALGLGLIAAAALASRSWFDRHFLPEFLNPRAEQYAALDKVRIGLALVGAAVLLVVRPWIGGLVERRGFRRLALDVAPTLIALILAVGVSELVLERIPWRAAQQSPPMYEPRRWWNDRLGWRHVPDRTGYGHTAGRTLQYALDVHGWRVRRQDQPLDLDRPTIVFAGESIVYGHGLTYEESLPGRVEALTGYQVADMAVGGYAIDQAYMTVADDLPKFRRPAAVVMIFMPGLFHRSLDTDRPRVVGGLRWIPPAKVPRLIEIKRRLVPYRSGREVADGIAATQEQLRTVTALAKARGAIPLIIVPELGPEPTDEADLRRRILDAGGVPYLRIPLAADWHLANNRHPDPRGAEAMAQAVVGYLKTHGLPPAA